MNFKVGDIIRGVPNNGYVFTNEWAICEVVDILEDSEDSEVKVVVIGQVPDAPPNVDIFVSPEQYPVRRAGFVLYRKDVRYYTAGELEEMGVKCE